MKQREQNRLIKRCVRQDGLAQKLLYEQYKTAMFSTAYRLTNDWDLAHDVLQEAFIKVFQNLKSFKGKGTLGSWIKTIVVRSALRETSALHVHVDLEQHETRQVSFDDTLTGELLHELIGQLPERCRLVFVLIEVEGYSHKEVAEMTGVTVGTTKSQLHYAKRILRDRLKEGGYEAQKRG